jgi:hypothetical protein
VHWPCAFKAGSEMFPREQDGTISVEHVDFIDVCPFPIFIFKKIIMKKCIRGFLHGHLIRSPMHFYMGFRIK